MENILVTGAGGASGIACLRLLSDKYEVIAVDSDPHAPGLFMFPRKKVVPLAKSQKFIEKIFEISIEEGVSVILPTVDEELLIFSTYKEKFESKDIKVCISSPKAIRSTTDKYLMFLTLRGKVPLPATWLVEKAPVFIPMIIKPRVGRGGRGLMMIDNFTIAKAYLNVLDKDWMVQKKIEGEEYDVDVLITSGRSIAVIKKKLKKDIGGNTICAMTVKDIAISRCAISAVKALELTGVVNVEIIKSADGVPFVIEVNARPSGAVELASVAGCNLIKAYVDYILGKKVSFGNYKENILMTRYLTPIFAESNNE